MANFIIGVRSYTNAMYYLCHNEDGSIGSWQRGKQNPAVILLPDINAAHKLFHRVCNKLYQVIPEPELATGILTDLKRMADYHIVEIHRLDSQDRIKSTIIHFRRIRVNKEPPFVWTLT